jgi:UDP-glucose 4-epimerase
VTLLPSWQTYTPDGTCIRDYIHVLDIADAHVRAIDYLMGGGESCSINLANARGYSVKEVISTAERVCGKPILVEIAARRAGDPAVLIGTLEKAQTLLGWRPERSDLELQISDAWNWMKNTKTSLST